MAGPLPTPGKIRRDLYARRHEKCSGQVERLSEQIDGPAASRV